MKSPSSMTIDSTAAEPKRKTTASEKEKEKENDVAIVVSRNSRKRSSAAISHRSSGAVGVVTPPRPSSSGTVDGSSWSRPSGPNPNPYAKNDGGNNNLAVGSAAVQPQHFPTNGQNNNHE